MASKCPMFENGDATKTLPGENVKYKENLQLDTLLNLHTNLSGRHDETFFHTFHQIMELWFRQVIAELDSVRELFLQNKVDNEIMVIIERLDRMVKIFQVLTDQMKLMDTLNPLEFVNFRSHLGQSSGFESFQFRLIENKLGVKKEHRVMHNKKPYTTVFEDDNNTMRRIRQSEDEQSLLTLVDVWLSQLYKSNSSKFETFKTKFSKAFVESRKDSENVEETLKDVMDKETHEKFLLKGERRISWESFLVALTIQYHGKCGEFKNEWQLLNQLMDLDAIFMKWRYSHMAIVYRQLGVKHGTGGSSGYYYLRSTISERYHIFKDLFRTATYLLPEKLLQT